MAMACMASFVKKPMCEVISTLGKVISLASTVLVLGVSGRVTQRVIRAGKDGEHD